MNILLVSNMYPNYNTPTYGTFVKNIHNDLDSRPELNIERVVIAGKPIGFLRKLVKYFVFYTTCFYKCLLRDYDVVYVHYISHSFLPVWLARCFRKTKLIVNIHGGDVQKHKEVSSLWFFIKEFIASKALKHSNLVIVPSSYYSRLVQKKFALINKDIVVYASGGIDTSVFHPLDNKVIKQSRDKLLLGYAGRLEQVKGVLVLPELSKMLKEAGIEFRLKIYGDGALKEKVKNAIEHYDLKENVSFEGAVDQTVLAKVYNEIDILLVPSESESLGLVCLEAMSCGCPILASDIGGINSYLVDGVNGFSFKSGDVGDMFNQLIKYFYLDQSDRNCLSQSAIDSTLPYASKKQSDILYRAITSVSKAGLRN